MKIVYISLVFISSLSFSACSSHQDRFYDRANNASEKSLQGLDRDTK